MSVIARRPDPREFALSPLLANAIKVLLEPPRRYAASGEKAPLVIASGSFTPSTEVVTEAQRALPGIEAALVPASLGEIRDWLQRVNAGVRIPLDRDEFDLRFSAIGAVCSDLPAKVWNDETLKTGLKAWRFFPSAADVAELLEDAARPLFAARDAVLRLATGNRRPAEQATPRRAPTPEELAWVHERVEEFKREAAVAVNGSRAMGRRERDSRNGS
jgi:hypothetical protein